MSARNSYGWVVGLTSSPTARRRRSRRADPSRFGITTRRRRALLLGAAALLLFIGVGLGRLAPPGAAAFPVLVATGAAWVCLVLAMLLPPSSEQAGDELTRRLARFRHELNGLGDFPSRSDVLRVIGLAGELGLQDPEIAPELEELRACLDALDLQSALDRGELPVVDLADALPEGDQCVFACPVRFGRRRTDQFGHLLLTSYAVRFRGSIDTAANWGDVSAVRRAGREMVLALRDSRRQFRFACHSVTETMQACVYAEYLRAHTEQPAETGSVDPHRTIVG